MDDPLWAEYSTIDTVDRDGVLIPLLVDDPLWDNVVRFLVV